MWKTEECAEAAELLSGLVVAVIILMLVVKLLREGGRGRDRGGSLADPLPPNAKLKHRTDRLHHHHHHHYDYYSYSQG